MSEPIYSFPPIADAEARLLILGTMPSEASLREAFYYAHPRNCFWPMMADILGEARPSEADGKRSMLIRHRIALWDVARCCIRPGSLDSDIRSAEPNDITGLFSRCPKLELVLLNGGTAERLFRQLLPELVGVRKTLRMPSTSPAYTLSFEHKRSAWSEAMRAFTEQGGK